jgi:hypothetical protein
MRTARATLRRRVMLLMIVYVGLMSLVWPYVRTTTDLPLKALLACLPIVPMTAALWLMAMDIVHSDELQQRVHLIALSVATGFTCATSFTAGFLCSAGVLTLPGDALIWVLPVLALSYSAARWVVGRRYGGLGCG